MDDGLVPTPEEIRMRVEGLSLNPCCSGRWSSTGKFSFQRDFDSVLILVVVDDGLVLSLLTSKL